MALSSPTTPSPAASVAALRQDLDRLVERGRRALRQAARGRVLRRAPRWAGWFLPGVPAALVLARWLGATEPGSPSWPVAIALTLLLPLLAVGGAILAVSVRVRPTRAVALARYDELLQTRDRLVTADEFLRSHALAEGSLASAFMQAAVHDTRATLQAALAHTLPRLPLPPWQSPAGSLAGGIGAVLLLLLTGLNPGAATPGLAGPTEAISPVTEVASVNRPASPPPVARRIARPAATPPASEPVGAEDASKSPDRATRRQPKQEDALDGQTGSGGSSLARSSNAGSQAAGSASSQKSQAMKRPEAKPPAEDPPETSASSKPKRPPRKQEGGPMSLDANSGQGKTSTSSGSQNPFEATEESDKTGQGSQLDAEDEGAEDEDEQEKSNSVSKPMGNTKEPAVDRNLSNQPPGDDPGNGRGGPSQIKKTRGVPSMILGIPVPDRVPGVPSPGRSKVTQEFTRPKEEAQAPVAALSPLARTGAIGHVEQPDLVPWRRTLVETYFSRLRQASEQPSGAAGSAPR
jgi:hypothetical protein